MARDHGHHHHHHRHFYHGTVKEERDGEGKGKLCIESHEGANNRISCHTILARPFPSVYSSQSNPSIKKSPTKSRVNKCRDAKWS